MHSNGVYNSILDTIGNTPLIRLNKVPKTIKATVYAKVEAFNPGHSAKDRIAKYMIERAEQEGKLQQGGTIIETTSGNTGFSLAMIGVIKGYRCILCVPDKISDEKLNLLRAMGAEVIVCPSNVKPEDPQSYYSRAKTLHANLSNSFYVNQYFNDANLLAHYNTTGPEIWNQTGGKITHYIASCGTGGTLSGTARYLKEQNPDIRITGVDAYGSVLKKYHETGEYDEKEIYPYKLEAVGKNIIPSTVDFSVIDKFVKVSDKASAFRARQLSKREGLFVGYSSGAAMQGIFKVKEELTKDDIVVVLFPDHGSRYLGKIFNNEWMEEQGFLYGYPNYKYMLKFRKFLRSIS
ncbi:MAG: pyridoxal-phosphate dependent enzyme [Bacteroidota bacterium]